MLPRSIIRFSACRIALQAPGVSGDVLLVQADVVACLEAGSDSSNPKGLALPIDDRMPSQESERLHEEFAKNLPVWSEGAVAKPHLSAREDPGGGRRAPRISRSLPFLPDRLA